MGNVKSEGCPRCRRGDISVDKDQYGWYEYCLQCGYVRDLVDIDKALPGHPVYLKKFRHRIKIPGKGEKINDIQNVSTA